MNTSNDCNTANKDQVSQQNSSSALLRLTNHAMKRMQQRSIKHEWINLVLEYGNEVYQKGNQSYSFSLDKVGVKKIKNTLKRQEDWKKLRQLYVVVSNDGAIVTCAYR